MTGEFGREEKSVTKMLGQVFFSSKYLLVTKSHMKIFGRKAIESILFDK